MIGEIPAMMQKLQSELLSFIDNNNLKVTQLSLSQKSGYLCFDMPSQKRWKSNHEDGESCGGDGMAAVEYREGKEEGTGKRKEIILPRIVLPRNHQHP